MKIHAILFNDNKYTPTTAREWLDKKNYERKYRLQRMENYLRYTMTPKKSNVVYRTLKFGDDIRAIIEIPKKTFKPQYGGASTKIQAILFDKDKYTPNQGYAWLRKHNYPKPIRMDVTKNLLRFRIIWPEKNKMYRIINFGDDIKAVIEIITPMKKKNTNKNK